MNSNPWISKEISDLLEDFLKKSSECAASADSRLPAKERRAKIDAALDAKHEAWDKLREACKAEDPEWFMPNSKLYHIALVAWTNL